MQFVAGEFYHNRCYPAVVWIYAYEENGYHYFAARGNEQYQTLRCQSVVNLRPLHSWER